jgi:hypothetical protein
MSTALSVRLSAPAGSIFLKLHSVDFYKNAPRESKFVENRTKISVALHEDLVTLYCCRGHKFATKFVVVQHNITVRSENRCALRLRYLYLVQAFTDARGRHF